MCIDECIYMCTGMCIDICIYMCIDVCFEMWIGMRYQDRHHSVKMIVSLFFCKKTSNIV